MKVFGFGLGFGFESFRIGLKVLGFGRGLWVWGFEIWLRVWGLGLEKELGLRLGFRFRVWGFAFVDLIQSFGSGFFGFSVAFGTQGMGIFHRVWGFGSLDFALGLGLRFWDLA